MELQKPFIYILCGSLFIYLFQNILTNENYDIDLEEYQKHILVAIVVGLLGFGLIYIKPFPNNVIQDTIVTNSYIPTHL
jgi:hypothetical protein